MAYTSSQSQTSQGVLLQIKTVLSPVTWTTVGELLKGKFDDKNIFDDSTNTQSLAKEFLPVLPDPGKFDFTVNRVSTDAGQAALVAAKAAVPPTLLPMRVLFPVNTAAGQSTMGDQRTFSAYVEQLSPDIEVNKKITSSGMLQISGPITDIEGS
jgi:hypothetical protein